VLRLEMSSPHDVARLINALVELAEIIEADEPKRAKFLKLDADRISDALEALPPPRVGFKAEVEAARARRPVVVPITSAAG
jgi:hypothetical protein